MKLLNTCCFIDNYIYNYVFNPKEYNQYNIVFKSKFKEQIFHLIKDFSITHFISGMDIGIEQYITEVILEFKNIYPQITIEGVLPFERLPENWSEPQRDKYYSLMKKIDKETLLQYHYTNDCLWKQNLYMINNSKFILLFCNEVTYKTNKLVSYAKSIGRIVFIIDLATFEIKPNIRIYK